MSEASTDPVRATSPARPVEPFADLRRHNAYAAHVARLLADRRERRITQVIQAQRKHRIHQAR